MRLKPKTQWKVKIEDEATQVFQSRFLTDDDQVVLRLWAITLRDGGPEALLVSPSIWNDHPLKGKWEGHRASSFSSSGRVIYYIVLEPEKTVVVVKITTTHDYSKE